HAPQARSRRDAVTTLGPPPASAAGRLPETGLGDLMLVAAALRADAATLANAAELLGLARRAQRAGPVGAESAPRAGTATPQPHQVPRPPPGPRGRDTPDGQPAPPAPATYPPPRTPPSPRPTKPLPELLPEGLPPPPFQGLFPRRRGRALLGLVGARRRPEG